jgi:hypothetical protein
MRRILCSAAAILLVAVGCGTDEGVFDPNLPPETTITYSGPVSAVNSHLRVRWWGEDIDGTIMGFETRWTFNGGEPEPWVFSAATTDSFALPAPLGTATHFFEVRAVDDDGLADPTPASQTYPVWNDAPIIAFADTLGLPVLTLPAVTFSFGVVDSNGQETVREVRAWLDGEENRPLVFPYPAALGTFFPDDFDRYGERTVFLQALDDAGAVSNTISHTWTVVPTEGDLLVIDDMPDNIAGALTFTDPFYRDAVDEVMAGRPYTLHRIQDSAFRTSDEAGAIFSLFNVVIWYQGTNLVDGGENRPVAVASLGNSAAGIRDLLARGGALLLATMNAVGTGGAFDENFASEILGVESMLVNPDVGGGDTNFFLKTFYAPGDPFWDLAAAPGGAYPDLRVIGSFWGLELFSAGPAADVLYSIPAGIVFPAQEEANVATRVRTGSGGTLIYLGFPLSRCTFENRHREVIRTILRTELGL